MNNGDPGMQKIKADRNAQASGSVRPEMSIGSKLELPVIGTNSTFMGSSQESRKRKPKDQDV